MPTNSPPTPRRFAREYGQSGTAIFDGLITAEDYAAQLTGKSLIRRIEIMRRSDATAYETLMALVLPLLDAEYSMKPASDDKADKYVADFCTKNLFQHNILFSEHVREALNMLAFGYSVFEKTYAPGEFEGKFQIMLDKLNSRKQNSIHKWEMSNDQPGIQQLLTTGFETIDIPASKLIIYTNEKEGDNYEGISKLRRAYKDFDMKDKFGLVYASGLEKVAIPTPIVRYPSGADEGEKSKVETYMKEYRSNERAFMMAPTGWEIDQFKLDANGLKEVREAMYYYDRQMLRVAMAQFLEIGSKGSSGSYSASNNQNELYVKSLKSIAKNIVNTLQKHLVEQLCDLNFANLPNGYPQLSVTKLNDDDVAVVADAVQKLTTAGGLTMTYETEQELRGVLGISPLPEEYREDYDLKREMSKQLIKNPPANNPEKPPAKKGDKQAEAIRASQAARGKLIDVITG